MLNFCAGRFPRNASVAACAESSKRKSGRGNLLLQQRTVFSSDVNPLSQVNFGRAPLLWELGNDAVRPMIYFMTNPAVWDGLGVLCCRKKNRLVNEDDEEIEVPLSPVTTV